ncbi:hypothetical protein PPMP20_19035 [Paraburkholderia phymatum]|uniref:Uncharacterized protein n=1 Tax=Paraburkholderia phymatum (strain DSM 17167 / CIP 108236 / LMG 21445 / STM815) TaxID=391038 RepID=B2JUI9_PARP8|nr:hypothetical protein [Paraburkholderia phymatum]ACC76160.1 hypothetical protein Bphy_7159 [Paraburkholderia phymatum STM815]
MSNSTTLLDTIATNQANKEVVANALFDAASPGMLWGRHASACNLLTWGYYGGYYVGNAIANGTVTLTASATNYVYADNVTGAVSVNTSGVPAGKIPLYQIVTGTTTVTSYTDLRGFQPSSVPQSGAPYDVLMFSPGVPANSALMARIVTPRPVTFPSGLTGSYASASVAATAAVTLTLARNGSAIGTVNFAAGASTGTFTFSSSVTTAAGDVLTLTNQATTDATLANISVTLVGTR